MGRPAKITALVFGLFVFLGISFLLARAFTGAGAERAAVLDVVRAQAAGDSAAVLDRLPRCRAEPACVRTVEARADRLRRPGEVEILQYTPSIQVALTRRQETGRVVRQATRRPEPIVQCVVALREGPVTGAGVEVVSLSGPQGTSASC